MSDPNAQGRPHTVLGGKISSKTGKPYRQSATFSGETWPKANGSDVPWSEVHWGDHDRPLAVGPDGRLVDHPNPHEHIFNYDFDNHYWYREDPSPFYR